MDIKETKKKKWYQKNWGIILMLVLFFPVGIALMLQYSNWSKKAKTVVILFCIGFSIIYAITDNINPSKPISNPPSSQNIVHNEISEATEPSPSVDIISKSNTDVELVVDTKDTSEQTVESTDALCLEEVEDTVPPNVTEEKVIQQNEKVEQAVEQSPAEPKEKTVYWTENGKVYHSSKNCSTLSRSKNISSGTINESGKERHCQKC